LERRLVNNADVNKFGGPTTVDHVVVQLNIVVECLVEIGELFAAGRRALRAATNALAVQLVHETAPRVAIARLLSPMLVFCRVYSLLLLLEAISLPVRLEIEFRLQLHQRSGNQRRKTTQTTANNDDNVKQQQQLKTETVY
jgi:hypothetical protein